jgi:hypothetical protein
MGYRKPRFEVAEIVRKHRPALEASQRLSPQEKGVLTLIARCRTADMGGHREVCDKGHYVRYAYNSCGNRHCPKCQALAQERWLAARARRLLDVGHFHVVFTLPSELRPLAKCHPYEVYDALVMASAGTVLDLARDRKRAHVGLTTVLHTWTREMGFHPHVHIMVTAGGLALRGGGFLPIRSDYLFPSKMMGKVFRSKMLERLWHLQAKGTFPEMTDRAFKDLMGRMKKKEWVVYAKKPFKRVDHVIQYLARYTHRVGMANSRLTDVTGDQVTFRTRGDRTLTLHGVEFLRRLLLHILPPGFHKIRHFGLYASAAPGGRLEKARTALENAYRKSRKQRSAFLARITAKIRRLEKKAKCCPVCGDLLRRLPLDAPSTRAPPESAA